MVLLGLALLSLVGDPAPVGGQPQAGPSLAGSWRLVRYEDRPATGPPVFPFGKSPKGLLIYGENGEMSLQIMKQPHPKVASGDEETITPEEKQVLFDSFVAYFGTYSVDAGRGVVIHHVEGDFWAVFDGKEEERPFELEGDRLTLKPEWESQDRRWTGVRVFERVRGVAGGKMDETQLRAFATRYTAAWCSQDPANVASFFAEGGSLQINGGSPSVGRAAITEAARAFMTTFPDMIVKMDAVGLEPGGAVYRWTLTGTNTGPGGTGKKVRISGFEEWRMGTDGLIAESKGHFDETEYQRQLKAGAPGP